MTKPNESLILFSQKLPSLDLNLRFLKLGAITLNCDNKVNELVNQNVNATVYCS